MEGEGQKQRRERCEEAAGTDLALQELLQRDDLKLGGSLFLLLLRVENETWRKGVSVGSESRAKGGRRSASALRVERVGLLAFEFGRKLEVQMCERRVR